MGNALINRPRNGRTGQLLEQSHHPADTPPQQHSCRMVRAKLQAALLKEVDQSRIRVAMKLVEIEKVPNGRLRIGFEDGFSDQVDLLVGADGIRSVSSADPNPWYSPNYNKFVRSFAAPSSKIKYNGQSAYRTIVDKASVKAIDGIPNAPVFWNNLGGKYVFTCPLGGSDFEVTARIRRPAEGQEQVSWGQSFDFSTLTSEYQDFCEPVRRMIQLAAEGKTEEFALFSGPRLEHVVFHDALALIGDASHPLSGAFGAGAGFALEDVFTLAKSIEWAWETGKGLAAGLALYDQIRSPHYRDLYAVLDGLASIANGVAAANLSPDEEIEERVRRITLGKSSWIYHYEIDKVVERHFQSIQTSPSVTA